MKHIILFLFLLFCTSITFSQETSNELLQLEEHLANATSDTERMEALLALGAYELDHNFGRVQYILKEASQIINDNKKINGKYVALTEIQLGVLKRRKGAFSEATSHYLKALSYFEEQKDTANIADIYHNLGMVYKFQRDYEVSTKYFDTAIALHKKTKNKLGLGKSLLAKGSNLRANKKFEAAEDCFVKAKELFINSENNKELEQVNNFLVLLYQKTGRSEQALQLSKHNIARAKTNNETIWLINSYLSISNIYYKDKEYRVAGKYVDSALKLAKKNHLKEKIVSAYAKKSKLWYRLENYKSAYLSHRKYKQYSDSLFNKENIKKIKELELEYKFKQERKEIELITKSESAYKRLYFILFLVTVVSAITIGLLIRRNYKIKAKIAQKKLKNERAEKLVLDEKVRVNEEETKRLIADNSMRLEFKQELLDSLKSETARVTSLEEMKQLMNSLISKLQLQITTENKFTSLQDKIEEVNKGFDAKLRETYPKLTKTDREICALMRLNLSIKEIATIRNSSTDAVKAARYRIRKKMQLTASEELEYIIQSL